MKTNDTRVSRPADHPVLRPGGLTLTQLAVETGRFRAGDRVLDAGCGYGLTSRFLSDRYNLLVTALDADPLKVEKAVRQTLKVHGGEPAVPGPHFLRSRLPAVPFKSLSFKGIFCECVLSLVPDKSSCLAEFYRILEPGGILSVTDLYLKEPDQNRLGFGQSPPVSCLDGAITLDKIMDMTTVAGFEIDRVEDHTWLLNQMVGQMIFDHGGLDRLNGLLPANLKCLPAKERLKNGRPKPGYMMMTAKKHG